MKQLNRPVAQTVLMMLGFVASESYVANIRAVPHTYQGIECTYFSNSYGGVVIVMEPDFHPDCYSGVRVHFIHEGSVQESVNYRGPDIADIAADMYKFLTKKELYPQAV